MGRERPFTEEATEPRGTGTSWDTVVAFPVAPEASGFTFLGADFSCPQCHKGYEVELGF
jgi:hypothetical protein